LLFRLSFRFVVPLVSPWQGSYDSHPRQLNKATGRNDSDERADSSVESDRTILSVCAD
jgi:hypothetical protein